MTIMITGMTCGGCSSRVAKALREVPGVIDAAVSHTDGRAVVKVQEPIDGKLLTVAIEKKGYQARIEA